MTNIDDMHSAIGEVCLMAAEIYGSPGPEQMTENRFPFTYAYDCVRAYPKLASALVPEASEYLLEKSRSEGSRVVDLYAERRGLTKAEAAVAFAIAYCQLANIRLDGERYNEVIEMIAAGKNDAEIVVAGNLRRLARWDRERAARS